MESMQRLTCLVLLLVTGLVPSVSHAITLQQALQNLAENVLLPSSSSDEVVVRMTAEPLPSETEIKEDGGAVVATLASATWFAFINDKPCEFFQHPVRYVLIDDSTGGVSVFNQLDWPLINNVEMGLNEGPGDYMIWIYPVLSNNAPITPSSSPLAPTADYGDAPDGQDAYTGVTGNFPTLFSSNGARALTTGEEILGITVSDEQDATDPSDPDGEPNLVDADADDRFFIVIDRNTTPATAYVIVDVTISAGAPSGNRYLNGLFDFDSNGSWSGSANGLEWAIQNRTLNISPNTTETVVTAGFDWGDADDVPEEVWLRLSLTRSTFAGPDWDGSGAFSYGEIEDGLFYLQECTSQEGSEPPGPDPEDPDPLGDEMICDAEVECFSIVVEGHEKPGQVLVQNSATNMFNLFQAQGCSPVLVQTKADFQAAMNTIKGQIECLDTVQIYIIAHGKEISTGRMTLVGEYLTGSELDTILDTIDHCVDGLPGDDCFIPGTSCHLSLIIESCFSGNFNMLGATGRSIAISSQANEPSWARAGGGHYSNAYIQCCTNGLGDANGDGKVTPVEAAQCVKANGLPRQTPPDVDDRTCKCACCSDGTTDPGEQCDDGNKISGDGCSYPLCQIEGGPIIPGVPGLSIGGVVLSALVLLVSGVALMRKRFSKQDR